MTNREVKFVSMLAWTLVIVPLLMWIPEIFPRGLPLFIAIAVVFGGSTLAQDWLVHQIISRRSLGAPSRTSNKLDAES